VAEDSIIDLCSGDVTIDTMTLLGRARAKHDLEETAGSELYELKRRLEEERSQEKESFQRYVQWLTP
jgi:hypothetical protein